MIIAGRNVSVAAIVAAVGGLVAIVAAPLSWAGAKMGDQTQNLNGFDSGTNAGKVAVVLGVIVLVLVALWILQVKVPPVAGLPTIQVGVVVAGVLIVLAVVLVYFTSILADDSLSHMSDLLSKAGGSVSLGIAFFLEAIAGIVVIVGGGLALSKKG